MKTYESLYRSNTDIIKETLNLIESQIGLKLALCDCFPGLRFRGKDMYFNVVILDRVFLSKEFAKLERFANSLRLIKIEPNGVKRIAIFPIKDMQLLDGKVEYVLHEWYNMDYKGTLIPVELMEICSDYYRFKDDKQQTYSIPFGSLDLIKNHIINF